MLDRLSVGSALTRALPAAAALIAAASLAGCGGDKGGTSERPAVTRAVSSESGAALERAAAEFTIDCLREKGWPKPPPENDGSQAPATPYGLDDIAFREKWGYGARRLADGTAERVGNGDTDPEAASAGQMSPAEAAEFERDYAGTTPPIVTATPDGGTIDTISGGCFAEGRKAVYGDDLKKWITAVTIVNQLEGVAQSRVWADPAFRKLIADWAGCMKKAGWSVAPGRREPPQYILADPQSEQSLKFAVDDATCGQSLGVQKTGEKLQAKALTEVSRRHEAALITYNELALAAQKRVQDRASTQ